MHHLHGGKCEMKDWTFVTSIFLIITSTNCARNSRQRSESGMADAEMERLQFLFCRNLSLIVPLYCLGESLLKTEIILGGYGSLGARCKQ
jgi:hypothetical protein